MTMEPAATRARTQGDKGEPFRPQRNAIFERPRHMHSASAAAARVHACVTPPLFRAAPLSQSLIHVFSGRVYRSCMVALVVCLPVYCVVLM